MNYLVIFLLIIVSTNVSAETHPRSGPLDPRLKTIAYNERDVVKVVGHYGFQTTIEFSTNESIENISIGDSIAWQVVPNQRGNLLFIKPIEENAQTNLTVVTSFLVGTEHIKNRIYNFSLDAKQRDSHASNNFTWHIKYRYQDSDNSGVISLTPDYLADLEVLKRVNDRKSVFGDDLDSLRDVSLTKDSFDLNPELLNYSYSFAGDTSQVPLRIFDNGEFTFFKFKPSVEKPAIFSVDKNQTESIINASRHGEFYVVHRVGRQFTLRNGDVVTCIFNEELPVKNKTIIPHKDDYKPDEKAIELSLRD